MEQPKVMTLADLAKSTKPQMNRILSVEEKVAQKRAELEAKHRAKTQSAIKELTDAGKTFIGAEDIARIEEKSRKDIMNRELSGATTVTGALELTEDVAKIEEETNIEIYGKYKITQDELVSRGYTEDSVVEYIKAINQAKINHLNSNPKATPFDTIDLSEYYNILRYRDDHSIESSDDIDEDMDVIDIGADTVKCNLCNTNMSKIYIPGDDDDEHGATIYECELCGNIRDTLNTNSVVYSSTGEYHQDATDPEESVVFDNSNHSDDIYTDTNSSTNTPETSTNWQDYRGADITEEMVSYGITNSIKSSPKNLRNLTPLERMKLMNSQLGAKISCYLPISNYTITVHENKSATYLPQMYNILGVYMENGILDKEILRNIFDSSEFHVKGDVTFDKFMTHTDASEVDLIFALFALANAPRDKATGKVHQQIFTVKCEECGYIQDLVNKDSSKVLSINTFDEFKNSYPSAFVANRMLDSYIYNQDISIEESNSRVAFGEIHYVVDAEDNKVTTVGIKRPSISSSLTRTTHAVSHVINSMRKRQKIDTSDLKLMTKMTIEEQHNFMQTGKYANIYNTEYATLSNIIIVAQFVESINIEVTDTFAKEQQKISQYSRMSIQEIKNMFKVSISFNAVSSRELLDTLTQLSDDVISKVVEKSTEIMSLDSELVCQIKLEADRIKTHLMNYERWASLTKDDVKAKADEAGKSYEEVEEARQKLINGLCPQCNSSTYIVEGSSLISFLILQKMNRA
ncbi:MAG: hypothetical protein ACRCX2_28495 [Paraclostridium sp.]